MSTLRAAAHPAIVDEDKGCATIVHATASRPQQVTATRLPQKACSTDHESGLQHTVHVPAVTAATVAPSTWGHLQSTAAQAAH